MMVAASTSETSVNFYQTTRHNIPEDSHLRTCRRENLKFYYFLKLTNFILFTAVLPLHIDRVSRPKQLPNNRTAIDIDRCCTVKLVVVSYQPDQSRGSENTRRIVFYF
jgi:hypothetical protein